ncbi:Dual specificity protein phosphatase cdc14a [Perkinsus olseni]|uniref:Dual specificity protein phosphatase cdc14a n=1 Tax=Perkinsus olseni TaxID=32597 RepID=A0A7J6L9Y2_PEROL|nr:Dual specificity protein phosphatase cdc14a [Perkinsus olseni]KAF4659391.1 Dual specificity protein phosphatase cdc14a [Perkinsus olseni]
MCRTKLAASRAEIVSSRMIGKATIAMCGSYAYPAFPSRPKAKSVEKRVGFSVPHRSLLRHHHRGYSKAVALDGLVSSHPVKELIPQRFYFTVVDGFPVINPTVKRRPILLNIDDELVYDRFYRDFGPLNLAQITIYLRKVKSLLESGARDDRPVVHYCCSRPEKRSNAILLASAYLMFFHKLPPGEALERVEAGYPPVVPFRDASVVTLSREAALVRREILTRQEHESSDDEEINGEMPTRCVSHNRAQLDPEGIGLLDAEGRVQNARMLRRKRRMRRVGAKYVTDRQVPEWIKCGSCGAVLESKRQKRASHREVAEVTSKQKIDGLVTAALKDKGVKPDEGMTDSVESDEEEFITITEHEMAVDMLKEECEAKVQEALQLVKERDEELVQITGSEVRWREACNEARAQRDVTKERVVCLEARLSDLEANLLWQKEQTTHLEVALAHHEDICTRHLSRLEVCLEKVHDADLQRRVLESLYRSGQLSGARREAVESDARHRERIGGLEKEVTKLQGEKRRMEDNYDRVTLRMRTMAEAKVQRLLRPTTKANRLFAWDAWRRVRPQLRLEMQMRDLRRELGETERLRQVLVGTVGLRDKEIAEKASRIGELKIHVKELTQRLEGVEHEHRAQLWRVKDKYHARTVRATDVTFSRLSARWQQYVATKERNWTVLIDFLRRRLSWLAGFIRDESMLREIS